MERPGRVRRTTRALTRGLKRARVALKARRGALEQVQLYAFYGYGNAHEVHVAGRLLEAGGVVRRPPRGNAWQNLRRTVRRFLSAEIPCARLVARWDGREHPFETDNEGYFHEVLPLARPWTPGWHQVELEVLDSVAGGAGTRADAEVLIPPPDADFGIISDIDDTVVHSAVTNRVRMVRIVLFQDAHSRLPFPGVSAFYEALTRGPSGRGQNPLFFVSKSPWNLYDLLETFFDAHGLPRAPLFLRDLSFLQAPSRALGLQQDKLSRIRKLLGLYPHLAFVLIGDSGQKDPEIYAQVVRENPGRVRAVYIRDVTARSRRRAEEIARLAAEVREHDVPMLLAADTDSVATHARALGLIHAGEVEEVREVAQEEKAENAAMSPMA